jgi:hypothetical protein
MDGDNRLAICEKNLLAPITKTETGGANRKSKIAKTSGCTFVREAKT